MRDILFRGFHPDKNGTEKVFVNGEWITGEWVYGYYVKFNKTEYCFKEDYDKHPDNTEHYIFFDQMTDWGLPNRRLQADVIPETVGEYTGLVDNKGKLIFEGDIVLTQERYNRPYSKKRKSKRHVGVVKYQIQSGKRFYNKDTGKMDRKCDYGAKWMVYIEDYGVYTHGAWGDFFDCEVIGNIHDNPELLDTTE